MSAEKRFVDLHVTRTPFETRVVAEILQEAGIPAQVNGEMLADEFALSQRLMNLQGVTIRVPEEMADAAREAIATARAAGKALEQELATQTEPPARPAPPPRLRWVGTAVLCLAVVGVGGMWLSAEVTLARARQQPLVHTEWTKDGFVSYWRDTRTRASEAVDLDHNGVPEQTTFFNRAGEKLNTQFDADQDGVAERFELYRRDGTVAQRGEDADEDGRIELVRELLPDGTYLSWRDLDRDDNLERVEFRDAADKVVLVQERRGRDGFVTVK